ncbi:MAG: hypothetical protein HXX13_01085 [Bacteroidetes bacterium]|nr:hypothetical protein [Bacteroidota bacterium]
MNTTIQLILTYTTICLVSGYVLYKLARTIFHKKEVVTGCGSNCGCDSNEEKKALLRMKTTKS